MPRKRGSKQWHGLVPTATTGTGTMWYHGKGSSKLPNFTMKSVITNLGAHLPDTHPCGCMLLQIVMCVARPRASELQKRTPGTLTEAEPRGQGHRQKALAVALKARGLPYVCYRGPAHGCPRRQTYSQLGNIMIIAILLGSQAFQGFARCYLH